MERLAEVGAFLAFASPARQSAGEARQAQAWEAAALACSTNHPRLLNWLFSRGWPDSMDKTVLGYLKDNVPMRLMRSGAPGGPADGILLEHEYELYWNAVGNRRAACLEALIDKGCRSPWICAIAAAQGRKEHLRLAARGGCPCGWLALSAAAVSGHLPVLEAAFNDSAEYFDSWKNSASSRDRRDAINVLLNRVAEEGHADCLGFLLREFGEFADTSFATDLAAMMAICSVFKFFTGVSWCCTATMWAWPSLGISTAFYVTFI